MPRLVTNDDLGKKHGKLDMDRVGLFSEMPYMIGDKYQPIKILGDVRDLKKSQMYPGILKTKTGLQDAYFDQHFKRLFEKEKYQPPLGLFARKNTRGNTNLSISTRPFLPSNYTKRHSTPGDYFGTFGPKLPAISTAKKPLPKKEKLLPQVQTAATNTRGPGYADRGFSPFPEYKSSPYNDQRKHTINKSTKKIAPFLLGGTSVYFSKNPYYTDIIKPTYKIVYKTKFKGTPFIPTSETNNIGKGFDRWPSHSAERYIDPYKITSYNMKSKSDKNIRQFYPQTRNKSFYTMSTMQRKLKSAMNNNNWRAFEPITFSKDRQL